MYKELIKLIKKIKSIVFNACFIKFSHIFVIKESKFKKIKLISYKVKFFQNIGQSTLEFVLIFPLVIIAVLIIAQLGYIVYIQNILNFAASQGARKLSTTNSNEMVYDLIYTNCPSLCKEKLNIKINPFSEEQRKVGSYANISIEYDYDNSFLNFLELIFNKEVTLKSSCIVRMESEV